MIQLSALGFILALIVSILATPAISWLARQWDLLDRPNARKVHTNPTPRLGGIGIGLSIIAALLLLGFWPSSLLSNQFHSQGLEATLVVGILGTWLGVLFLGLADDIFGFKAVTKFQIQLLFATVLFFTGFRVLSLMQITNDYNGWWFMADWLVTVGWMVAITNAINLIDGMDGLAGSISALVLSAIVILSITTGNWILSMASLVVLAGTLGFLQWNRSPALLFLGDSGSLSLGWFLAITSILAVHQLETPFRWVAPLFLLGYPITDVLLAIHRRIRTGLPNLSWPRRILRPDKNHIHHRLLLTGYSSNKALVFLNVFCCLFILSTFIVLSLDDLLVASLVTLVTILGAGATAYVYFFENTPDTGPLSDSDIIKKQVLIFGWDESTPKKADRFLTKLSYSAKVTGLLQESPDRRRGSEAGVPVLGSYWDLYRLHRLHPIDAILVGNGVNRAKNLFKLKEMAYGMNIPVIQLKDYEAV